MCFISSRVAVFCEEQTDILVIIHWKSLWSIAWVLFNGLVKMVHKSVINNCLVSMNPNDFIQYLQTIQMEKSWKFTDQKVWEPFVTLIQYYTNHMDHTLFVCLYFGAWIATVLIHFYWAARIFIKNLFLCSAVESQAGTTWGRVNDRMFIFGWTIPLGIARV